MVAAVCCSALACSSVRWLKSVLPWEISALAVATLSALPRTSDTTLVSEACMSRMAASTWPVSSRRKPSIVEVRSPSRMRLATSIASAMGRVMLRVVNQAAHTLSNSAIEVKPISSLMAKVSCAWPNASAVLMSLCW